MNNTSNAMINTIDTNFSCWNNIFVLILEFLFIFDSNSDNHSLLNYLSDNFFPGQSLSLFCIWAICGFGSAANVIPVTKRQRNGKSPSTSTVSSFWGNTQITKCPNSSAIRPKAWPSKKLNSNSGKLPQCPKNVE